MRGDKSVIQSQPSKDFLLLARLERGEGGVGGDDPEHGAGVVDELGHAPWRGVHGRDRHLAAQLQALRGGAVAVVHREVHRPVGGDARRGQRSGAGDHVAAPHDARGVLHVQGHRCPAQHLGVEAQGLVGV